MGRSILITLLCLIFSAGCVKLPIDEARCTLSPTPGLENLEELAFDSRSFEEGDFPSPFWWGMFNDGLLNQLISQARSSNPTLLAIQERIEEAEAYAKVEKSRLFPTIGFSADIDWQ